MSVIQHARGLKGRHVLWAFLGFFGTVFLANGIFLYAALSTYSGVVAQEPYRKGLDYNDRIAAGARQDELGWRTEATLTREQGLSLVLRDKAGTPVSGLSFAGFLGRPSTNQRDLQVMLTEVEPGRYTMAFDNLEPGAWLISLEAKWPATGASEPVYRLRERLWLKS